MGRRYRAELRDEQAAATRERLLEAAHRLLGHIRPVDLSYARIAEEAGVSVRTLYRHFPTSDDLFLALSDRLLERVGAAAAPPDVATALEGVRHTFEMMQADPALFRVFFAVPTRSRTGGGAMVERLLAPYLTGLSADGRRAVCALIDLMVCPYAWDVLHANWGADADLAFRATAAGIRAVLELAARDPAAFDHVSPLPEVPR
jgi:AcrR family transcriptional regulator